MGRNNSEVVTLIARDGDHCHYCNVKLLIGTTRGPVSKNRATRDHIVPKSFGGINSVSNYVLACSECNETRGNSLFYCHCEFCETVIDNWFNDHAWNFANPGRFKIFKESGRWTMIHNGRRSNHKSHQAAMKAIVGILRSEYRAAEEIRSIV